MNRQNNIKNNISFIKEIFKADPFRIPYDIFIKTLQSIMGYIVFLFAIRMVLNSVENNISYSYVFIWLLIFGIAEIFYILIRSHYYEVYAAMSNIRIYAYFRKKIYKKIKNIDYACFDNTDFYDKYIRILSNIDNKVSEEINAISALVSNSITLCTVITVLVSFDITFVLLVFIPFFIKIFMAKSENKERHELFEKTSNTQRRVEYTKRIFFFKDYAKEIRLSSISNVLLEKFQTYVDLLKMQTQKSGKKIALYSFISGISADIFCYSVAVALSGYRYLVTKTMLLGDVFLVIDSIRRISNNITSLAEAYQQFKLLSLFLCDVNFFFCYKTEMFQPDDPKNIEEGLGTLELQDVSFCYPHTEKEVLHNIYMTIKPKQKIAIVGHNGCGKAP